MEGAEVSFTHTGSTTTILRDTRQFQTLYEQEIGSHAKKA
jgi:hypothetical protein